jgi:uncharacterized protein (TIGR02300 family)
LGNTIAAAALFSGGVFGGRAFGGGGCVVKAEWGLKRICPNCGTRYYDFRKEPPTCPACGTVYDPEALLKSRRARAVVVEEPRKLAAKASRVRDFEELPVADADDGDLVPDADAVEDDDGAALIEDAGELGEDSIEEVEVEPTEDEE